MGRLLLLLALAALLAVPGCQDDRQKEMPAASDLSAHPVYSKYEFGAEDNVIDIGVQPLFVPMNIIHETMKHDRLLRRALADKGMEIRFHDFYKGQDINFFVERGDLEAAIVGDMPALTAAATMDVMATSMLSQGVISIVADKPMLIEDLRGKRVAYPAGSNAHHALLSALASAGVSPDDVTLVAMDVDKMSTAFARGDIDAFSSWEPTPSVAVRSLDKAFVIHRSYTVGFMYFVNPFYDKHPDAVRDVAASVVRALIWMRLDTRNLKRAASWAVENAEDFSGEKSILIAEDYIEIAREDMLGIESFSLIPARDLEPGGYLEMALAFLQDVGKIPATAGPNPVLDKFDRSLVQDIITNKKLYGANKFDYEDLDD
ncbi:MAG TPA: hypothetical protein ENI12_03815 [Nitrospirae bacterium]|nr:hypothetical protein [Nitrospirota bacterium]